MRLLNWGLLDPEKKKSELKLNKFIFLFIVNLFFLLKVFYTIKFILITLSIMKIENSIYYQFLKTGQKNPVLVIIDKKIMLVFNFTST